MTLRTRAARKKHNQPIDAVEEILFCVESTNDIVSKLVEHMEKCCKYCYYYATCEEEKIEK